MKAKMKRKLRAVDWVSTILVIAGAINWGLVGFFNYDLVKSILPMLAKYVYMAVGLAGAWILYRSFLGQFMKK